VTPPAAPEPTNWTAVVAIWIALYGAVLSTYNLARAWWSDRKRVRVTMGFAFYVFPGGGGAGETLINLEAVNLGSRPVTVSAPCLRFAREDLVLFRADGFHDFPKELTDGASGAVRMPVRLLAESLDAKGHSGMITIRPVCKETTGRTFFGKRTKFDVAAVLASLETGPVSPADV
jgi:hypothetical protein